MERRSFSNTLTRIQKEITERSGRSKVVPMYQSMSF